MLEQPPRPDVPNPVDVKDHEPSERQPPLSAVREADAPPVSEPAAVPPPTDPGSEAR
jgi:hypothetical protein